ncbi:unnamed protein product [Prunus armeniaca]
MVGGPLNNDLNFLFIRLLEILSKSSSLCGLLVDYDCEGSLWLVDVSWFFHSRLGNVPLHIPHDEGQWIDLPGGLASHEYFLVVPKEHGHRIVAPTSHVHWSLDIILNGHSIYFDRGLQMLVTCMRANSLFLSFFIAARSCSTYLGPLKLPVGAFFHPSLLKAKVSNQVNLVKELSNQVVLVIYSLSQLVNSKTEFCLTMWIKMRELC